MGQLPIHFGRSRDLSKSVCKEAVQEITTAFFIRSSRGELARVAEEAKNHFETGRCSNSDGFSARHSSREYGYYEQFRGFRSGPERRYE